jgi:hypothetical protein
VGYSYPDCVWAGLRGLTDNDGKTDRRWEGREGLPVDVLGQDRFENVLAWLMRSNHILPLFHDDPV